MRLIILAKIGLSRLIMIYFSGSAFRLKRGKKKGEKKVSPQKIRIGSG